ELASMQDALSESELDLKERELTEDKDVEDDVSDAQGFASDIYDINSRIIDLQRDQLLLPQEGMSPKAYNLYTKYQQQLDDISKRWTQAKTDMATEEALVTAYSEVRNGEAQVARNALTLKNANKELKRARKGTAAPAGGVITECFVDSGAVVQKGSEIYEMQTDDRYKVRLLISRFDVDSIKVGQEAEVSIGKKTYRGSVIDIGANATDDVSGKPKARVDVRIESPEDPIIGLESDVVIYLKKESDVVRIPVDSVYTDDEGSYTYVSVDGKVEKRYIEVGVSDEDYTQVKEGIEEGEHIVSDPNAIELEGEKILEKPVGEKEE
ncbi:MAG: HlyD family efflux transporter periplasmic adaptor subunit, partial [Lachnospiraceae bacterium]|nr:HlyD family efflux transporter periplasmic adaptor subunit [Lachnospiraceae bacterium]